MSQTLVNEMTNNLPNFLVNFIDLPTNLNLLPSLTVIPANDLNRDLNNKFPSRQDSSPATINSFLVFDSSDGKIMKNGNMRHFLELAAVYNECLAFHNTKVEKWSSVEVEKFLSRVYDGKDIHLKYEVQDMKRKMNKLEDKTFSKQYLNRSNTSVSPAYMTLQVSIPPRNNCMYIVSWQDQNMKCKKMNYDEWLEQDLPLNNDIQSNGSLSSSFYTSAQMVANHRDNEIDFPEVDDKILLLPPSPDIEERSKLLESRSISQKITPDIEEQLYSITKDLISQYQTIHSCTLQTISFSYIFSKLNEIYLIAVNNLQSSESNTSAMAHTLNIRSSTNIHPPQTFSPTKKVPTKKAPKKRKSSTQSSRSIKRSSSSKSPNNLSHHNLAADTPVSNIISNTQSEVSEFHNNNALEEDLSISKKRKNQHSSVSKTRKRSSVSIEKDRSISNFSMLEDTSLECAYRIDDLNLDNTSDHEEHQQLSPSCQSTSSNLSKRQPTKRFSITDKHLGYSSSRFTSSNSATGAAFKLLQDIKQSIQVEYKRTNLSQRIGNDFNFQQLNKSSDSTSSQPRRQQSRSEMKILSPVESPFQDRPARPASASISRRNSKRKSVVQERYMEIDDGLKGWSYDKVDKESPRDSVFNKEVRKESITSRRKSRTPQTSRLARKSERVPSSRRRPSSGRIGKGKYNQSYQHSNSRNSSSCQRTSTTRKSQVIQPLSLMATEYGNFNSQELGQSKPLAHLNNHHISSAIYNSSNDSPHESFQSSRTIPLSLLFKQAETKPTWSLTRRFSHVQAIYNADPNVKFSSRRKSQVNISTNQTIPPKMTTPPKPVPGLST